MTNQQALAQLRETASSTEAMETIRVGLAVLFAQGAAPDELLRFCADTLVYYSHQNPVPEFWN